MFSSALTCQTISGLVIKGVSRIGPSHHQPMWHFSTTSCLLADPTWRANRKLPRNPNSYGPLTDAPDYTFLDGRPVPPGKRRLTRMRTQQELAMKAVQMISEIDFAVDRHQKLQNEEEERRQKIIASKLKQKGPALLKK